LKLAAWCLTAIDQGEVHQCLLTSRIKSKIAIRNGIKRTMKVKIETTKAPWSEERRCDFVPSPRSGRGCPQGG
jgi:hypothetical protein